MAFSLAPLSLKAAPLLGLAWPFCWPLLALVGPHFPEKHCIHTQFTVHVRARVGLTWADQLVKGFV